MDMMYGRAIYTSLSANRSQRSIRNGFLGENRWVLPFARVGLLSSSSSHLRPSHAEKNYPGTQGRTGIYDSTTLLLVVFFSRRSIRND